MFCICDLDLRLRCAKVIPCTPIGSIESPTYLQNAGCTMAIHADCTKAKITRNHNLLIFIDIVQLK